MTQYPRGACVVNGGDDIGIMIIKSGQMRVYLQSDDGRDITLYRLFSGDVSISLAFAMESITFDISMDAEEDTEVLLVHPSVFHEISEKNIYVKCFSYQLAVSRFSDIMWAMQQILFMSVDRRLAIFLNNEVEKNNTVYLKLTHEQIARYMGSAREVVTRMLKYFSQEGIVELSRGGLKVIDRKKLCELAGDAYPKSEIV